jgi:hypothetical protein
LIVSFLKLRIGVMQSTLSFLFLQTFCISRFLYSRFKHYATIGFSFISRALCSFNFFHFWNVMQSSVFSFTLKIIQFQFFFIFQVLCNYRFFRSFLVHYVILDFCTNFSNIIQSNPKFFFIV